MRISLKALVRIGCAMAPTMLVCTSALAASTDADFRRAYAAAEAAQKEAGILRNRWIATESALDDARKAADKSDFDRATSAAKEAEALAKASIFQATSEKEAWKDLEIR
jgi:hypothetical protein